MFCHNCGRQCGDARFCPACGTKLFENESIPKPVEQVSQPSEPIIQPVTEEPTPVEPVVEDPSPIEPVAEKTTPIKPVTEEPIPVEPHTGDASSKKRKKKSPVRKIILSIVAVILVAAIALASVSVVFVSKPNVKIALAMYNLIFNTESFEFNFDYEYSAERSYYEEPSYYEDEFGYNIYDDGGWKTNYYEDEINIQGALSFGDNLFNSDLFVEVSDEDAEYLKAISDKGEALLLLYEGDGDYAGFQGNLLSLYQYTKEDTGDVVEAITGQDYDKIADWLDDELQLTPDQIFTWTDSIVKENKINGAIIGDIYNSWGRKAIAEELLDEKENDLPDYETIKKIALDFIMNGLSAEAVEINDKYKENGVSYYDVTFYNDIILENLLAFMENCEELKRFLNTDYGEELFDEIKDDAEYIRDEEHYNISDCLLGISDNRLSYIEYETSFEYESDTISRSQETTVTIEITSINQKIDFPSAYKDVYNLIDDKEWKKVKDADDIKNLII